jgi:hypothetical protein
MSDNKPPSMASLAIPKKRKYTRRPVSGPFVIEKGIPIPEPASALRKYPWHEMEPGDSFYVPNAPKSLQSMCSKKRGDGLEFAARKEKNGLRVWRTK